MQGYEKITCRRDVQPASFTRRGLDPGGTPHPPTPRRRPDHKTENPGIVGCPGFVFVAGQRPPTNICRLWLFGNTAPHRGRLLRVARCQCTLGAIENEERAAHKAYAIFGRLAFWSGLSTQAYGGFVQTLSDWKRVRPRPTVAQCGEEAMAASDASSDRYDPWYVTSGFWPCCMGYRTACFGPRANDRCPS